MVDRDSPGDTESNGTNSRLNVGEYSSLVTRFKQSPMVQPKKPHSLTGSKPQLHDDSVRLVGMKMVSLTDANVAFHRAAARGNTEEVRRFLSEKRDAVDALDEHGFTALHYAAQHNQVFVVDMLLDFGAKVAVYTGIDGSTPLHLAAR